MLTPRRPFKPRVLVLGGGARLERKSDLSTPRGGIYFEKSGVIFLIFGLWMPELAILS